FIFAGEIALAERRIAKKAHLLAMENFGEPDLEGAVDEIEGVLDRDDARQAQSLGDLEEGHHAPWRLVGETDEPDLALLYELAKHAADGLDGMALAFLVHIV